jgi:hypothetical protein
MAQRPVRVRLQDIKQGKTIWFVDVKIQSSHHSSLIEERIKKHPLQPRRWYNEDDWGRAQISPAQRFFISDARVYRHYWDQCPPLSVFFFKQKDAQAYYDFLHEVISEKQARLNARFPASLNPPKSWQRAGENVVVAQVDVALYDSSPEDRASVQREFQLAHSKN